jgi:uncharacterized protein
MVKMVQNRINLQNKVIVITGASQGIGKCLAEQLALKGCKIILMARSKEKLKDLKDILKHRGCSVDAISVDLTSNQQIKEAFKVVFNLYGSIDILINNAAVGLFATVRESSLEDCKRVFDTNFFGPILCIQYALPMIKKHGSIVNISSAISKHASFYQGIYSASKSALDRLSEALRIEEYKNDIRIISIYIDRTKTNFRENMLGSKENYILPFKGLSMSSPANVANKIILAVEKKRLCHHTSIKSKLFTIGVGIFPSLVNNLFIKQYHKLKNISIG